MTLGIVPFVVLVSSGLAIAVAAMVLYRALTRVRAQSPSRTDQLIHFLAGGGAALGLVAIAWTAFIAAVAYTCAP